MMQFLNKMINLGIHDSLKDYQKRAIKIMNSLIIASCLPAFISSFFLLPMYADLTIQRWLIVLSLYWACLIVGLYLNYKRLFLVAKSFTIILSIIFMSTFSLFAGRDSQMHFFLVELVVVVFLLFTRDEKKWSLSYSFLLLISFLTLDYLSKVIPPVALINPEVAKLLNINNAFSLFLIMFIASYYNFKYVNDTEIALENEKEKSENLLLNILPEPIAIRLKTNPGVIADNFTEVTILFADIVNFTALSSNTSPENLVRMLDDIFREFDFLTDKYSVEKIKTIGDAYMVAGGIPLPNQHHCDSIIQTAIEMQNLMKFKFSNIYDNLELRIGVHCGPVVAGIIGHKKFSYDLWGDTVNTASRMESHGLPGKIHVSEQVFCQLKDKYKFIKRDNTYIKGKGEMTTYILSY